MNLPPLPQPDTTRRLLTELAGWLRARVRVSVKRLFDTLDDSLFELAEHTTASTRQQQYFDGMRECRRRRDAIERDFLERLGHGTPSPGADEPISDTLALVVHEELEEDLAIASMASKAQQRLAAPLHALNQRIAFLRRQPSINDDDNPFGPAKIAYAFKSALAGLGRSTAWRDWWTECGRRATGRQSWHCGATLAKAAGDAPQDSGFAAVDGRERNYSGVLHRSSSDLVRNSHRCAPPHARRGWP